MKTLTAMLLTMSTAAMAWNSPQGEPYGSVFFDTDSAEVYGYDILPIDSQDKVTLVGHADRRWTDAHNLDLSKRRAQAVAAAIGRPDAEILAKGSTQPASDCPTDDEECLLIDRRVDIYVECGLSAFACTAEPPFTWGQDSEPVRMVTDRSRF